MRRALAVAGLLSANLGCGARSGLFLNAIDDSAGGSLAAGGTAGAAQSGRGGDGAGVPAGGSKSCGALIDDMEDGSGRICTGEGRQGVWYVFNDGTGTQRPAKTSPGVPIQTAAIPNGRQGSTRAIQSDGSGFRNWGSGVGFDLDFDGVTYRLYDASRYAGIGFWARGLPGETMTFRVSGESTTAAAYGGTCIPTCSGPLGISLALGPGWINYTVSFAELNASSAIETNRLTNIQFKSDKSQQPFDFWIDDVRFLESKPSCCPDLAQCQGGAQIADPALKATILGSGNLAQTLDCSAICSLRSVNSSSTGVRDLEGLECLSSLARLELPQNQIAELSPLATIVGLVDLDLTRNLLTDLAPLTRLTNLSRLDLSQNQITDIAPLANLVGLSSLSVADNQLTNIEPLAALVRLQALRLSNNQIQDLSPLGGLAELTALDLAHNAVSRMEQLSGLTKLLNLTLANNSIESLGALSGLPVLNALDLSENRIVDVRPLTALHALAVLNLAKNRITDPSPLSSLSVLNSLDLSGNQLQVLGSNFRVPSLTTLSLSDNGLTQLASLSGLSFQTLNLAHNQLSDLGALAGVTFANIPCYRCGSTPGKLDLSNNQIAELSPLLATIMPNGFAIDLRQNSISCAAQAANIAALRAHGVALSIDCP